MDYIKPEMLEDGKVLICLKIRFSENRTQENFAALLSCIRDSVLVVPMKLSMDKNQKTKDIKMKPDILKQGDKKYLPVFSNYEQLPAEYAKDFTAVSMSFPGAKELSENFPDIDGLVLDAFSLPMIIEKETAGIIMKIASRLPPEN